MPSSTPRALRHPAKQYAAGIDPPLYQLSHSEQAAFLHDRLGFLRNVFRQHADIAQLCVDGKRLVVLNSPALIADLLVRRADNFTKGAYQRSTFRRVLGRSLSVTEGALHAAQRRALEPIFTARELSRCTTAMRDTTLRMQSVWLRAGEINFFSELCKLTIEIFSQVFLADSMAAVARADEARRVIWTWMKTVAAHEPNTLIADRQISVAIRGLRSWMRHGISRVKHDGLKSSALLARIPLGGGHLGSKSLCDQLMMILFAAHETTPSAVFWTYYLLLKHPKFMAKVTCEVDRLGAQGPSCGDLQRLPYLAAALKESVRLYPPAAWQARVAVRDTTLGDFKISKGSTVAFSQYLLHRRSSLFADANNFTPSRFLQNPCRVRSFSYLPYGAGKHACLGSRYAALEQMTVLALLLRNVQLEVPRGQSAPRPILDVALHPECDLRVTVRRRTTLTSATKSN